MATSDFFFFLLKIWRVLHTFSKRKPRVINFAPDFFL
jgi:hypothetical protein